MNLLLEGDDLEALLLRASQEGGTSARIVRAEKIRRGGFLGFFAREGFEVAVEIPKDAEQEPDLAALDAALAHALDADAPTSRPGGGAARVTEPATGESPASLLGLAERASVAERAAAQAVTRQAAYQAEFAAAHPPCGDDRAAAEPVLVPVAVPVAGPVPLDDQPVATADPAPARHEVTYESMTYESMTDSEVTYDAGDDGTGYVTGYDETGYDETGHPGEDPAEAQDGPAYATPVHATASPDPGYTTDDDADLDHQPAYAGTAATPAAQEHGPVHPHGEFAPIEFPHAEFPPDRPWPTQPTGSEPAFADPAPAATEPAGPAVVLDQEIVLESGTVPAPLAALEWGGGRPQFTTLIDQLREGVRLGRHRFEGPRHSPDHTVVAALHSGRASAAALADGPPEPGPGELGARAETIVPRRKPRRGSRGGGFPGQRPAGDDTGLGESFQSGSDDVYPVSTEGVTDEFTATLDTAAPPRAEAPVTDLEVAFPSPAAGPMEDDEANLPAARTGAGSDEPGGTGIWSGDPDPDDVIDPLVPAHLDEGTGAERGPRRTSTEAAWRLLRGWRPGRRHPAEDDWASGRPDLTPGEDDGGAPGPDAGAEREVVHPQAWVGSEAPTFADAATNGMVPAAAPRIETIDQLARDREALRALGVPAAWTRHLVPGDRFGSIVRMLDRLIEPRIPADAAVIAVVGPPDVVELEAARTALDLPTDGRPRAVTLVPGQTGADRRSALARSRRIRPVVISVPIDGYDDPAGVRAVLAAVKAEAVIAVVDAGRPLEEITRWVEALERVDALALDGALDHGRPAAVLGLDLPVIRVDGISVDRIGWAALLCAQLSAPDQAEPDRDLAEPDPDREAM
jgi:hypothetical protein